MPINPASSTHRRSASSLLLRIMLAVLPALVLGAGLVSVLPANASTTTTRARGGVLDREVQTLISKNKMGQADVGVYIVDVDTGEVLASYNERKKFIPASNLKLVTTAAAAMVLGKDYVFRTRILLEPGRAIVIGSGDPALADPELLKDKQVSVEQFLQSITQPLIDAKPEGIKEVVVDDRAFDRDAIHPTWPKNQLSRWYCAPVSGLNFHTNILEVWPKPGTVGEPASYRKVPDAPWIEITNKTRTVGNKGTTAIGLDRDGDANLFILSGTILSAPQEPVSATLHDPAIVFGRLIAERLAAAGLSATDPATGQRQPINVRLASAEEKFDTKNPTVVIETPLAAVLRRSNVDSYNLYADALLKCMGHKATGQPGSWTNGAAVVRMQMAQLTGQDAGDLVIVDGSGMSADNQVSPLLMGKWLSAAARHKEIGDMFVESLAMPGEGTLHRRFLKRPPGVIHAKSGFIRGVQNLSGYVSSKDGGRRLAFAVMVNKLELAQGSAKELHEDIVRKAAEWLERQPTRRPASGG